MDKGIGHIEDTLRENGLLERTNLIVTSDHGFSMHTGGFNLQAMIAPFASELEDGSSDIVVAEGAIYVRGKSDPSRVATIVAALQRRTEVGAIFTRPGARGGPGGSVAGTLSFDIVRWNYARSGDILVSALTYELTSSSGEFRFGDPRVVELKGITAPQIVRPIHWE